jgi:glycosyltransferase involved in cell wall biosynthesis
MKCLIITPTTKEKGSGFAFRVRGLQSLFSEIAETKVFEAENTLNTGISGKIRILLQGYSCTSGKIPKGIEKGNDFVLLESLDLFPLRKLFPKSKIIYDAHNVGWELLKYDFYNAPLIKNIPFGKKTIVRWLVWRATQFEKNALKKADAVLVCSEIDKNKYLSKIVELKNKIFVLPNCINTKEYPIRETKKSKNQILFFGSFSYSANIEAAKIIDKKIAPKLPEIIFNLAGIDSEKLKVKSENINRLGFLKRKELLKLIQDSKIIIVPLLSGSGTRIKILESFAMGKAVISTSKGAEGIKCKNGKNIIIENNFENFAEQIKRLLCDKKLCNKLGKNARKLAEQKYDWKNYKNRLTAFLKKKIM